MLNIVSSDKNRVIFIIGIVSIVSGILGAFGSVPVTEVVTSLNRGSIAVENRVGIEEVSPQSPAAEAGLTKGDTILAVNRTSVVKPEDVTTIVNSHKGELLTLSIQSKDGVKDVQIVPRVNPPPSEGSLGVGLRDYGFESKPASEIIPNLILRSYLGQEERERFVGRTEIYQDKTFSRLRGLILGLAAIVVGVGVLRMKLWGVYGFVILTLMSLAWFTLSIIKFPNYLRENALELSLTENGDSLVYIALIISILFAGLQVYFAFYLIKHKALFAK